MKKAAAAGLKSSSHMAVNNWHHLQQNALDGVVCNGDAQKTCKDPHGTIPTHPRQVSSVCFSPPGPT